MPKVRIHHKTIVAFFLLSACSDVGDFKGADQGASNDMPAAMEDMDSEDADLSSGEDMPPVGEDMGEICTPKTKVSVCMAVCGEQPDGCGGTYDCGEAREEEEVCADACGSQPDGCGGTIECEPCACENGHPVQPTCGPCNLGTASCDEQDNLLCQLPPVPDIETLNCELDVIYVSNTYTGTSRLGTKAAPFKTIVDGLSAGVSNTARLVIATNTQRYEEDSALVIGSGTSFIGGYSADWQYTPETKTEVTVAPGSEDTVGISATGISLPTVVANVDLETSPNVVNGNNYGIYANAANRLTIDNVIVVAGKGGDGKDGTQGGGNSLYGGNGIDGLPGQTKPNVLFAAYDCPTPANLIPETSIGFRCTESYSMGGTGGSGGCTNTPPTKGFSSNANVDGGMAGNQSTPNGRNGTTPPPWGTVHRGTPGTGGSRGGSIENSKWLLTGKGGMGGDGRHGRGGGGGGGAFMRDNPYASGPMGGRGGNGGCKGLGAEGGNPGGTSFGVFTVDTFGLEIRGGSQIQSSSGGDGGDGLMGGQGGPGGSGGLGTDQACEVNDGADRQITNCETLGYKSGDGGDGTAGSAGGPGGGGAGGDSYGIYCHGSTIAIDASTTIEEGSPGTGGQGGTYPDEGMDDPDEDGEDGISAKTFGCN